MKLAIVVTLIAAALLALSGYAMAGSLYGTTDNDFFTAKDRYAHTRTVEEYRRIIPTNYDMYGFCRSAGHIKECLQRFKELFNDEPKPNKSSCIHDMQGIFDAADAKRICDSNNYAKPGQLGWMCQLDSGKVTFYRAEGGAKRKRDAVCE
jgi:hypothetical protein